MATTVTRKGQVTIPKSMRDRFGIAPGTSVDFAEEGGKLVVLPRREPVSHFAQFRGIAKDPNGLTTDEIMRIMRGDPDW